MQNWQFGLGVLECKWLWVSFIYPVVRRVMIISLGRSRYEKFIQRRIDFLWIRRLLLVFLFHKFCHVVSWVCWMSVLFMSPGFRRWKGGNESSADLATCVLEDWILKFIWWIFWIMCWFEYLYWIADREDIESVMIRNSLWGEFVLDMSFKQWRIAVISMVKLDEWLLVV